MAGATSSAYRNATLLRVNYFRAMAGLPGAAYVVRRSLHNVREINRAKKALKKAFQVQQAGMGFSMVELLSSCPTNWGMKPTDAQKRVLGEMSEYFPLGTYKERKQADFA